MSTIHDMKKRVLEYAPLVLKSYKKFLDKNKDIDDLCLSFIKSMPHTFKTKTEVIKTIFYKAYQIPKCKICGKRLSYRAGVLAANGKGIQTCGAECRKKYSSISNKKREETLIKKYGVRNISCSNDIKLIKKQKSLEKYGVENVAKSAEVKRKMQKTCLERYGVLYSAQSENVINAIKNKAKNRTPEERILIRDNIKKAAKKRFLPILIERFKKYNLQFVDINEYEGYNNWYRKSSEGYLLRCTKCNTEFRKILHTGHDPMRWCPVCNKGLRSAPENELVKWLSSYFNIERNKRNIIKPQELDIFIPEKNIALEFNGLYYHSKKESTYHLKKTENCNKMGIKLIHIFEDEWYYKEKQTKSLVKDIIDFGKHKIDINKCYIKEITDKEAKRFINKYSLFPHQPSSINLGIFYKNRLIYVSTFRRSKYTKTHEWELITHCSTFNFSVKNGLIHLTDYFKKNYSNSLIYYEDRRYPHNISFNILKITKPTYYYTKNFDRYSRLDFSKDKQRKILENYDNNLSEMQNMINNKFNIIYDCGKIIYEL